MKLLRIIMAVIAVATASGASAAGFGLRGYALVSASQELRHNGSFDTAFPELDISPSYTFGRGWSAEAEINYCDKDRVELTQLFISKEIGGWLTLSAGRVTVPVGFSNTNGDPDQYFCVTPSSDPLVPDGWAEVGLTAEGNQGEWQWLAMAMQERTGDRRAFGAVARIGNTSITGLSVGLTGYTGNAATEHRFALIQLDFDYRHHGLTLRGNAAAAIGRSPTKATAVAEGGYDIFRAIAGTPAGMELTLFSRYGFSCPHPCHNLSVGLNWRPVDRIIVKADYSVAFIQATRPQTLSLGVAFVGDLI